VKDQPLRVMADLRTPRWWDSMEPQYDVSGSRLGPRGRKRDIELRITNMS
jgi:hypothetical protein